MTRAQFVVRENPRIYALIERNPSILTGPPFGFPPVPPTPPM